jgi:hypothetical protein
LTSGFAEDTPPAHSLLPSPELVFEQFRDEFDVAYEFEHVLIRS